MRFLGYTLGDPTAPMPQPSPELFEQMGKFVEEATKAGVLVATGGVVEPARRRSRSSTPTASSPCLTARSPSPRSSSAAGR